MRKIEYRLEKCKDCEGTGEIMPKERCPNCEGQGEKHIPHMPEEVSWY